MRKSIVTLLQIKIYSTRFIVWIRQWDSVKSRGIVGSWTGQRSRRMKRKQKNHQNQQKKIMIIVSDSFMIYK